MVGVNGVCVVVIGSRIRIEVENVMARIMHDFAIEEICVAYFSVSSYERRRVVVEVCRDLI